MAMASKTEEPTVRLEVTLHLPEGMTASEEQLKQALEEVAKKHVLPAPNLRANPLGSGPKKVELRIQHSSE